MSDSGSDDQGKKPTNPPPIEFLRPGEQQPSSPPQQPVAWVPRPEDFQRPTYTVPPPAKSAPAPGRLALLAGALLVASGVVEFLLTFALLTTVPTLQDFYNITNSTSTELATNALAYTIIFYAQAFAFVSGLLAFQKRNWRLAVSLAFLSASPVLVLFDLLGPALSLVAVVLLYVARREFAS